jgi:pimeloyl-ACP methyl ester carboxylesterase
MMDHIFAHSKGELAYIDRTKIGLIGLSLGDFLAARAAAFEPRLAALILIDGVWKFEDAVWAKFPHCKDAWDA